MDEKELLRFIGTPEDEHHDFKEKWYSSGGDNSEKAEMLKDIFSFVNTIHDDDCHLIFGVEDDTHRVVGVENDENRYNTQKLTDWLKKLPIEPRIPNIKVQTLQVQGHEIDVLIIENTDNVPIFLRSICKGKGYGKHPVYPGQIFTRVGDTNTSINGTADYDQLKDLFRKNLGLTKSIKERFKKVFRDWYNWEYYEHTDEVGIMYLIDPDFKVVFKDRESDVKADSFSLLQIRVDINWEFAQLKYRNDIVEEINVVNLDGGRFKAVVPDIGAISNTSSKNLFYSYFRKDSMKFQLEELINHLNSAISPDEGSYCKFMESIVLYEDYDHQNEVEQHLYDVEEDKEPNPEEMDIYKSKLESDIPKGSVELSDLAIKSMTKQIEIGKYVKSFMKQSS